MLHVISSLFFLHHALNEVHLIRGFGSVHLFDSLVLQVVALLFLVVAEVLLLLVRVTFGFINTKSFFDDEFHLVLKLLVLCLLLLLELLLFHPFLVHIELQVGLPIPLHFEQFLFFVGTLYDHLGHHIKLLLLLELLVRLLLKKYFLVDRVN